MVYAATSEYGYITGDELEAFSGIDYSANNAVYTEAVVMAKVTIAEKMINGHLGVTGAQTITDGIEAATIMIAAHLMAISMEVHATNSPVSDRQIIDIRTILSMFLGYDAGVDAIPMSGADR